MSRYINLLFIPYYQDEAILIPQNLIDYVLPYAPPLPTEHTSDIVVGSIIYHNEKVPVLNLSLLHENSKQLSHRQSRLIIVSSVVADSPFSSYAIISSEAPRVLEVSQDDLKDIDDGVSSLFYSKVKLINEETTPVANVPDLAKLESSLFSQ